MKVTVNGLLHWERDRLSSKEPVFRIFSCDMTGTLPNVVMIKPVSVEVEIDDDFNPVPGLIEGLRKHQQEILAKAQVQSNNIEQQIQELLCIEYKEGS